jgi:hypothetical protein
MLHLKALFRARGIKAPGKRVYHPRNQEEWLAKLTEDGIRFRAQVLYAQLDGLRELRPKAKAAMVAEVRKDPAWIAITTGNSRTSSRLRPPPQSDARAP